jgi:hypothetical protein
MIQKAIEFIILKQVASYLAIPIAIIDIHGNLIYCNECCENHLGFDFIEKGEMTFAEWSSQFLTSDAKGHMVPIDHLPFLSEKHRKKLHHHTLHLKEAHANANHVEAFIVPIINQSDNYIGSIVYFQMIEP